MYPRRLPYKFKRRSEAIEWLLAQGFQQSANDKTHFSRQPYNLQRRVLKAKHNQWFISIVS